MNSSYGKTCEKQHETKHQFTTTQKFKEAYYDD